MRLITLTTDFGLKDPFVASMKGVILSINPNVDIVDISHEISPQDILEAAFVLASSWRYFPSETIHVAVVDPGVGSSRRPILFYAGKHYFVGPDNGIFTFIYNDQKVESVIHATSCYYFRETVDTTFHGRDIFAPIAAWLSKGIAPDKLGEPIENPVRLPIPSPKIMGDNLLEGEVIYIDRFGNIMTNITKRNLEQFSEDIKIVIKNKEISGIVDFYAEGEGRGASALINSSGYLEIFIYRGNAKDSLGINIGEKVYLRI
ncbi:MAG: SAM-dependent chlorinase/fluorinase [Nitrospirota bacterium]